MRTYSDPSNPLIVHQLAVGPMRNWVYLLKNPRSSATWIVDPGWEADKIQMALQSIDGVLTGILLTHGHFDHVDAVDTLVGQSPVPVWMCPDDHFLLADGFPSYSPLADGDQIPLGEISISVIHTPGHSPGSVCFYFGNHLISGDTVFINGCGRCDLPGSDERAMATSLAKLKALPHDTIFYPGHHYGPVEVDTLAGQLVTNPYLTCQSTDEFQARRNR